MSAIQLGARGIQHRVVDRMEERLAARVGAPTP
jgi:hypothetical protein